MFRLNVPTKRGSVLNGVLFRQEEKRSADTVMIAITGIHGNFYSNPFYYNIGDTLNAGNIDFIYAQTNDAFGQIETVNVLTGKKETIGSWNERFSYTDEDIDACSPEDYHIVFKIIKSGSQPFRTGKKTSLQREYTVKTVSSP